MAVSQLTYGGDQQGLICGYQFQHNNAPQELSSEQAVDWLKHTGEREPTEFIWLHFNLSHANSERFLHAHCDLPSEFFDTLREDSHSTRIECIESSLLAVINDIHYDFNFETAETSTLWLMVSKNKIISVRVRPLRSIDALRESVRHGAAVRTPLELLIHLLREQENVLVGIIRRVSVRIDSVEDKLLSGKIGITRAELGMLRRVLVRLQRLLAPEPASLFRLLQSPPDWIDKTDTMELRQSTEEFSVVLGDMRSLQERIKLLQEELAAHVNEQNNRSLFVLTIVTVMALPINIVAGLFGMNVGGIPMATDENGFWAVVSVIGIFTLCSAWWIFKKIIRNQSVIKIKGVRI